MPRPGSASSGASRQHPKSPTASSPKLEPAPELDSGPPAPRSKRAKKRNRNRNRRPDTFPQEPDHPTDPRHLTSESGLYHHRNLSDASIESASLLDHRGQPYMRARRPSAAVGEGSGSNLRSHISAQSSGKLKGIGRQQDGPGDRDTFDSGTDDYSGSGEEVTETSRLLPKERERSKFSLSSPSTNKFRASGIFSTGDRSGHRPISSSSGLGQLVNFPPSVPGSPSPEHSSALGFSSNGIFGSTPINPTIGETVIDMSGLSDDDHPPSPGTARPRGGMARRNTSVEEDVCFPVDEHLLDGDTSTIHEGEEHPTTNRPRCRGWPDLSVLEDWAREEKEQRSEGIRARRVSDPVYVGGRLRPRGTWHREEDDMPYRFTYFNEEFASTIHSHTISELLQPGQTFEELFRPEPRVETPEHELDEFGRVSPGSTVADGRKGSKISVGGSATMFSSNGEGRNDDAFRQQKRVDETPFAGETATQRPTFWLDCLSPTDQEMKVLARAFGIHPLTIEDILLQEAREKVELFRNYYLVAYKTFEQDPTSENYLEPINVYAVVFREGILTVILPFSLLSHSSDSSKVPLLTHPPHCQRPPPRPPAQRLHRRQRRLDLVRPDRRHHRCLRPTHLLHRNRSRDPRPLHPPTPHHTARALLLVDPRKEWLFGRRSRCGRYPPANRRLSKESHGFVPPARQQSRRHQRLLEALQRALVHGSPQRNRALPRRHPRPHHHHGLQSLALRKDPLPRLQQLPRPNQPQDE